MKRRPLLMVFIAGALLFSAWGNVVAAAFCPRSALNRDCCPKRAAHQANQDKHSASCHPEMAGMEMADMQMGPETASVLDSSAQQSQVQLAPESSDDIAVDLPVETCTHCVSHSQTTAGTFSVVAIDPSKGLIDTNPLPPSFSVGLARAFADLIVPSEHGPPIPSSPRHVIINVFRI